MSYTDTAKNIIELVGGKENIESVTHCFTRLRFRLHDESKADKVKLEALDKVMGTVSANGQYQVIIGNEVAKVFAEVEKQIGGAGDSSLEGTGEKKKFSGREVLNAIASIFTPTIPALAGAGVIKGLLVLCVTCGLLQNTDSVYMILNAAADAVFYFMPIILGYTSAKVFKCNPVITMTIGGSLIYPTLVTYMAETPNIKFLGIPVVTTTYASTVIPIILAAFVYSKLEKLLDKVIPDMIKSVVAPMISLLIMVPATLIVFGPFGNYTSQLIGDFFQKITAISPLAAGAFFGGTYSILVMFGMHRALVPIGINEVSVMGSTTLWAFTGPSNFAQAGAAFGSFLKLKDKKMKSVALSAAITALFGITEPALYGVNLKYKKPMIAVVISGAIGGAIAGAGGARAYAVAIPSILTLPTFFGAGFTAFMISIVVAFVAAAALTWILGLDEGTEKVETVEESVADNGEIAAPVSGTVIPMEKIGDAAFASGAMGQGCAIEPKEGKVYAPCDGMIASLFSTKHALGFVTKDGTELLIHIGIDTVNLEGKYFKANVEQGDQVKKGQLLIEFDNEAIKKEGYKTETIVLVANANEVNVTKEKNVEHGDLLIDVK